MKTMTCMAPDGIQKWLMCLGFWFFIFYFCLFFFFLSFCCSVKCMSYQNQNQNHSINKVQKLRKKNFGHQFLSIIKHMLHENYYLHGPNGIQKWLMCLGFWFFVFIYFAFSFFSYLFVAVLNVCHIKIKIKIIQ